ncbi:PASTA domain-containing protein [Streptococcus sp. E24BD]|uniref:PASTA domain-containing protein n=1 Tax=Streptococcus sp. E24BD TaxID=3278715 RepID=UPI00359EBAE1
MAIINPKVIKGAIKVGKFALGAAQALEFAQPHVEKALDRHHEHNKELITVPQFIGTDLDQAKNALEKLGFNVVITLVKPDKRWVDKRPNEVVDMQPKAGRLHPNTIINLYYVDADIIDQSDGEVDLPVLAGMMLDDVLELLEKKGFTASKVIAEPRKDWANKTVGLVVDNDPKPNLLTKVTQQGTVIRVFYLTEEVIAQSQALVDKDKAQQEQLQKVIADGLGLAGKLVGDNINQLGKVADGAGRVIGDVGKNLQNFFNQKK